MDADEAFFKETGVPLFSSHMIDLSEEDVEYNIKTTAKYLERAAPWKQWLEMEIGITGGEEDGVNNEDVDNNALYTQPEDIWEIYQTLIKISPYFSIAAGFGNVHGVYQPYVNPESLESYIANISAVATLSSTPNFSPSTRITSPRSSRMTMRSRSSSCSTVDQAQAWMTSGQPSPMASSRLTLTQVGLVRA